MRNAMLEALYDLASSNHNVMLLTADLGYGVFEKFEEMYSDQFLNIGVAEQNMMGVATGLALEGKIIFTYSIGNFPTLRCLEQIRNDACYHELNINIIASGGGYSYGGLGMSHHATEDLSFMRALPGITIVAPSTEWEAKNAITCLAEQQNVGYLRIDKSKVISNKNYNTFKLGKSITLRKGDDITIISTGGIAEEAMKASDELIGDNIKCRVLSMHTIKPIDNEAIISACKETKGIISIEENNIVGGLGSAITEVCMDYGVIPKYFHRFGIKDKYTTIVGSQSYLRGESGILSDNIVNFIRKCFL